MASRRVNFPELAGTELRTELRRLTPSQMLSARVTRGPDWKWGDQDRGRFGTVIDVGETGHLVVRWIGIKQKFKYVFGGETFELRPAQSMLLHDDAPSAVGDGHAPGRPGDEGVPPDGGEAAGQGEQGGDEEVGEQPQEPNQDEGDGKGGAEGDEPGQPPPGEGQPKPRPDDEKYVLRVELPDFAKKVLTAGAKITEQITTEATDKLRAEMKKALKDTPRGGVKINVKQHIVTIKNGDAEKKVEGVVHEKFPILVRSLAANIPVMMVGPAGSGKSQAAHQAALALDLDFYAQSVCAQTTASQLLGYMDATGKYVRSLFRIAYEMGGVYLLDEIDAGNANVLAVLNSSLSNGQCAFPDGMIARHEKFRAVATANTWGLGRTVEYIGRQPIDAATLDRFASLAWGYDAGVEAAMCPDDRWRAFVVNARKEIERRQVRHLITPRASLYGHRMILAGMAPKIAAEMLVFKGLEEDTRKSIESAIPPDLREWFSGEVASA